MELYVPIVKQNYYHAVKDLYVGQGIPEGYDYEMPAPLSTNRLWRCVNNRMVKTVYGRSYQKRIEDLYYEKGWYRRAGLSSAAFAGLLIYYPPLEKAAMDLDNITKSMFDVMQHLRIFDNDKNLKYLVCVKASPQVKSEVFVSLRALEPVRRHISRSSA